MTDFVYVTKQRVRHIWGYEAYSAGRSYTGYKDADAKYKIYTEFGWDILCKEGVIYLYINSIYDEYLNLAILSDKDRDSLISKVINAEKFMAEFRIELRGWIQRYLYTKTYS